MGEYIPSHASTFELFATIHRITILQQSNVILGKVVYQVLGCVDLTKGKLVMVSVVEDVDKVCVEGVDVLMY